MFTDMAVFAKKDLLLTSTYSRSKKATVIVQQHKAYFDGSILKGIYRAPKKSRASIKSTKLIVFKTHPPGKKFIHSTIAGTRKKISQIGGYNFSPQALQDLPNAAPIVDLCQRLNSGD